MPKQSPIPDALDHPFWDACNEESLVLQHCSSCSRFQHPPAVDCESCGSSAYLTWEPVDGSGTIYSYAVVYDTPVSLLQPDQPFNVALIALDFAPGIIMLSHLPGTPVDAVPIGAQVELIFETTLTTGQKVPEWRVVLARTSNSPTKSTKET